MFSLAFFNASNRYTRKITYMHAGAIGMHSFQVVFIKKVSKEKGAMLDGTKT